LQLLCQSYCGRTGCKLDACQSLAARLIGNRFVATVLHPVFFTSNAAKSITVDCDPETGEKRVVLGKLVTQYLDVKPAKGVAVVGQPEKQVGAVLPNVSGGKY